MLGKAIRYTETYEKGWNNFQKFLSPLTEQLHAWLADRANVTGQLTDVTYKIIHPLFLCHHFHSSHHSIYAYINLYIQLLQG